MSEYSLVPQSPLGGFSKDYKSDYNRVTVDVSIHELTDRALVSVAIPLGGKNQLGQALKDAYQLKIPASGHSSVTPSGDVRIMGMQPDQLFLLFAHPGDQAVEEVARQLGEAAYYTDQSDSWTMLAVSGSASRTALARICLLDLHPAVFTDGAVTRTVMEHMGVIILRTGEDAFLLMALRSSARSLLHALEVSIQNTL